MQAVVELVVDMPEDEEPSDNEEVVRMMAANEVPTLERRGAIGSGIVERNR